MRPCAAWLALSAFVVDVVCAAGQQQHFREQPYSYSAQSNDECVASTDAQHINQLLKSGGDGAIVALCPFAHVVIDPHGDPITFTAPRQQLYTLGEPEDHTRATITIENDKGHFSGELTTAIRANCDSCLGVSIRNLHIDGGRDELGGIERGDALILIGGASGEQEVAHVDAWDARGYAILHADEGPKGTCTGVIVRENLFHTAGDSPLDLMLTSELVRLRDGAPPYRGLERPGHWTDGISIACPQSTVTENTVRDVSGVGIMLRGAHGTQVLQNTVVARDRDMLIGISIVAHPVLTKKRANMGGVIVSENRVHAAAAMIRVGISTGAGAWSTDEMIGDHEIAFASEILKNQLSSYTGYYAYAIAIADARGIVVRENTVVASTWGFETSACYERPAFALPTPLIRDPRSVIGSLQGEFKDQHYGFLLCVGPGVQSSSHLLSRHQINDALLALSGQFAPKRSNMGRAPGAKSRHAHIPVHESRPNNKGHVQDGSKSTKQKKAGSRKNRAVKHEGMTHHYDEHDDDDEGGLVAKTVGRGKSKRIGKDHLHEREKSKPGRMKQRQLRAPRKVGNSRFGADIKVYKGN
ncbi:hypothetical protein OIO90_001023 [Microbotryomycetes sp. JL221]|nr:hypothetical protein OIO90_001023 [Microbotryomycetes sp. JL221]